ncbi:MAG: histidine phosphatase family protein [Pseudomonadota bacterium]
MTRLALLRHGHTAWNREGRIQGRTDIPLDQQAIDELRERNLPAPWDEAKLFSSTLARARQTAMLVSGKLPQEHEALIEMNWGDWEGKKGIELKADPQKGYRDIEDWGWRYTPPNGESPEQVAKRLTPWLDGLTGDNVAICHIGVMRVLLAKATSWDFEGPAPFQVKRNRLYILEKGANDWHWDGTPVKLIGVNS